MKIRESGIIWGVLLAGTAVILGAMGAHALEEKLNPDALESFKTGVDYQMYHALAILFCTLWLRQAYHAYIRFAIILFITGTLLFSGSIYLLSTNELSGIPTGILGPFTPIGGLLLIIGWFILLFGFIRQLKSQKHD